MKCIVVYYSQTGNTEIIAKSIHRGIEKAAGNCDLLPIKEANPRRLYGYDLIGLGSPVHDHVEPKNVTAFLKDMRFVGGKHAFCFCTHATHGDFYPPSVAPQLKSRGLVYIGVYDCYAPCYLPHEPEPFITAGHPDDIDLKESEEFGKKMVELSGRIYAGETNLIPPIPDYPPPGLEEFRKENKKGMQKLVEMGVPPAKAYHTAKMTIDSKKCLYPECRLCMDNCPMDGIDLSIKPPIVGHPCMGCHFCPMVCPTGAIVDEVEMLPQEISLPNPGENYIRWAAEAEATGKFRRLVPLENIDWDNPIYKKHNKHPQWIIGKGLV